MFGPFEFITFFIMFVPLILLFQAKTESEVQQLKTRVFKLEIAADCQQKQHDEFVHKACHEISEQLVYLVGGNDGTSCLFSLDSYSPSADILKSLKPMCAVRSNATAVALNDSLYVFGGGNGSSWYDSGDYLSFICKFMK